MTNPLRPPRHNTYTAHEHETALANIAAGTMTWHDLAMHSCPDYEHLTREVEAEATRLETDYETQHATALVRLNPETVRWESWHGGAQVGDHATLDEAATFAHESADLACTKPWAKDR